MKYGASIIFCFLLSALTVGSSASAAEQQQRCEQRRTVLQYLSAEYSEKPVAMGVAENGGLIEVLTSHQGDTFTIIVTTPDGKTCMVAAGADWHPLILKSTPRT
jgi:hypothetical protein